ncbi:hypothetical protein EVAR_18329_1 [Eumeta japonica]|uniref:Uncharacterized protein n=1 Tax=Eumeta variegata TaxID=151549 RepID=A0A4C1VB67_EUMVA|nr:hypothetical protein EVAR_18329_1 [Eumeta japonica]
MRVSKNGGNHLLFDSSRARLPLLIRYKKRKDNFTTCPEDGAGGRKYHRCSNNVHVLLKKMSERFWLKDLIGHNEYLMVRDGIRNFLIREQCADHAATTVGGLRADHHQSLPIIPRTRQCSEERRIFTIGRRPRRLFCYGSHKLIMSPGFCPIRRPMRSRRSARRQLYAVEEAANDFTARAIVQLVTARVCGSCRFVLELFGRPPTAALLWAGRVAHNADCARPDYIITPPLWDVRQSQCGPVSSLRLRSSAG